MTFTPERTIYYKTYIKRAMVEGLRTMFASHPDPLLARTKVNIQYPRTKADYPTVLVKYYERRIVNAGVGHHQFFSLYDIPTPSVTLSASGGLTDRWYEYRIAYILANGETEASSPVKVFAAGPSTSTLNWATATDAVRYRVYRRSSLTPAHVYWETTNGTFTDDGSNAGQTGAPLGPRKWKHYLWNGDFEFAVYALSTLDRDLIADTLVQTIIFGDLENWTNEFYARVEPAEPSQAEEAYPGSQSNFIVLQSDNVVGYGESETKVPWDSEDDLLYQTSYRVSSFGEFYNLPRAPKPFIEDAQAYPYEPGRDQLPAGDPADNGPWTPPKPATQADIDAELAENPPMF